MKQPCEFCGQKIAPCGMPRHVSSKHRLMVLAQFRRSPIMIEYLFAREGRFLPEPLMLPSPNPLTIYSTRPLGKMAAPIPELRRPKGYQPPQNYSRPADILAGQVRYGRFFT